MTTAGGPQGRAASSTGWYVYGVVPLGEVRETVFDGLEGVGGGSVALVDVGQLAAIVSEVPLSEFGEEPIVDNLRDPRMARAPRSRPRGHPRHGTALHAGRPVPVWHDLRG